MEQPTMIKIGGKERRLKYDINTAAEVEEILGGRSLMMIMGNPAIIGFMVVRALLWGGLKHSEKGLTLQRVGLMIQEYNEDGGSLQELLEQIGIALRRAKILGGDVDKEEPEEEPEGDDEKN